ncbi:DNA excision repair protein ERCC-6 isoform X2 [Procambarus clarkii]
MGSQETECSQWEHLPSETRNTNGAVSVQAISDVQSNEEQDSASEMKMSLMPSNNILRNLLSGGGESNNMAAIGNKSSVAQELQDQDDELRALGISVVDQLSLERDVEAAVDKAVTKHTRKQRLQILKKEIKDIHMNVKQADNKLLELKNRLAGMRQRVVDPRMTIGVEKEVKDKARDLGVLRAREIYLRRKLSSAEVNEEELDDYDLEDGEICDDDCDDIGEGQIAPRLSGNERARLIREGQMTPFGTTMTSGASRTVSVRPGQAVMKEGRTVLTSQEKSIKKGPTKAELISSGEMTPFGTVIKMSNNNSAKTPIRSPEKLQGGFSDFEKYLKDQIDRQKQHSQANKGSRPKKSSGDAKYGVPKKRKRKIKEYIGNFDNEEVDDEEEDDGTSLSSIKKCAKEGYESKLNKIRDLEEKTKKSAKKNPLKMHILHPKKKKIEKVSGSITSYLESDQLKRTPRKILSERVSLGGSESEDFDVESGSGSEYVPSDQDILEEDGDLWDEKSNVENADIDKRENHHKKKLSKRIKKLKKKIDKDEDEWSEDDIPKSKGQKVCKSRDDGNLDEYVRRIENWKEERLKRKQDKILRGEDLDSEEEEEEGYEEFDGGFKIPLLIWNKLYKYQRTCVKWLWELHMQSCGGILGDEMGLGKTIQIIAFLVGLSYSRLTSRQAPWKGLGPVLIVCPATVLHQWVKEFHKWWPPFRVAVLHESGTFIGTRSALIHNINRYEGILVTSYTGARDQLETMLQYSWHYIILDEGHKIRNPEAQITVALKRFQCPHRLILSGSPIQNSLKELWSLFDFVFPGKLGTLPVFLQQFAVPITQGGYANASKLEVQTAFKCASVLRDTINPYLLRRMKNDVRNHLNLPDKNEQVLFCGLSEEQRKIYREYIEGDQVKRILGGRMKVFVGLINLRKICNHPDLYTGGPHTFDDNYDFNLQPELKYGWWARSGKMHVLHSVLHLWLRQGHRVLLFTQSRQMMCILEKFLMDEHYCYLKMDGTTSVSSRQPLIEKFNNDPSYFVFLLTTRVGGLGINLTGADRVVIFDPDWNPSTDSQARERAWRIGQLRHVTIYRLVTAGTIEEKIYHRQIFKQFLTNRVLKDPKQQRFFKTNDLYELFSLNEGDKEKTESSAIFAGTGSEIKVELKEKTSNVQTRPSGALSNNKSGSHQRMEARTEKAPSRQLNNNQIEYENKKIKFEERSSDKNKEQGSVAQNTKMEQMRELAKRLSQKIGVKVLPKQEKQKTEEQEGNSKAEIANASDSSVNDVDSVKGKNQIVIGEDVQKAELHNMMQAKTTEAAPVFTKDPCEVSTSNLENTCITLNCDIKDSEDLSNASVKFSTEMNKNASTFSDNSHKMHKAVINSDIKGKDVCQPGGLKCTSNSGMLISEIPEKHKKKHKKKDKHREREKKEYIKKKGRKFEGERIEFLVKKRAYRKTEEEEEAEKKSAMSQDQYVLEKLFRKSGVHTALSHDAILSNDDPDYLLLEGEAERVAKEAVKAVRASRAQCFRPQLPDGSSQSLKRKPKFGNKKSTMFMDVDKDTSEGKERKKDKKRPMFSGCIDESDDDDTSNTNDGKELGSFSKLKSKAEGSSGLLSSSQLLSRMRERNKGISTDCDNDDSDYDPEYPSTATVSIESIEPEIQNNIDILTDIRNFVAFQAEVDGKASTQEIINRFKDRLPPQQTPFFKALLTQICDFHREVSGKGIWSLKGEFR